MNRTAENIVNNLFTKNRKKFIPFEYKSHNSSNMMICRFV